MIKYACLVIGGLLNLNEPADRLGVMVTFGTCSSAPGQRLWLCISNKLVDVAADDGPKITL